MGKWDINLTLLDIFWFLLILGFIVFVYTSSQEKNEFNKMLYNFCPKEKIVERGEGFATTGMYCEGKKFACNDTNCYYLER